MRITLYGRPHAGNLAVEFLLAELGIEPRRVLVTGYGADVEPSWFAEVNPMRAVPVVEFEGGTRLTESGAIMLHLAELHADKGLAPVVGDPARLPYLRWTVFLAATIYPTAMQVIHPENYIADKARFPEIVAHAEGVLAHQWAAIDAALGTDGHLAGGRLSAADLYMFMFADWFRSNPKVAGLPNTATLMAAMESRPAIAAVLARQASREAWQA